MRKNVLRKAVSVLLSAVIAGSMLTGCGSAAGGSEGSGKLTEVSFVTPSPEASLDLAWFYAADELGYFEEEGIKVKIIEIIDGTDPKILASGQADFGGFSPAVGMSAVDSGINNVKAICNIVGYNHFGLAYNKDSGIESFADVAGESIGFLGDTASVLYNPILAAAGVDTSTVNYINYGTSEYEALNSGQVNVMGTWLSEYYMCEGMGYDWGYLAGDDVLPQIANSLWVNTDFAEKNPEVVKSFAKAIVKGMYFMYSNPEAVADLVLNRYPQIEMEWDGAVGSINGNLTAMLGSTDEEKKEKIDSDKLGFFEMEKVQMTMENLFEGGATGKAYAAEDYYTNEYLPGAVDYEAIKADADAYEFKSNIYKASH